MTVGVEDAANRNETGSLLEDRRVYTKDVAERQWQKTGDV